jgi:hypothetical protein
VQFQRSLAGLDGMFGGRQTAAGTTNEVEFAPPRMQLHQDTGLENLFGSVFSLEDEPREVSAGQRLGRAETRSWLGAAFWTVVIAGVCSVGVSLWMMVERGE